MVLLTESQLLIFTYTLLATLSLTTIITSFIIKNLSMNVKWHCFSTVPLLIRIYVHSHILLDDNNIWRVGHNNENNNCSIEILSLRDQIIMQIRRQIDCKLDCKCDCKLDCNCDCKLDCKFGCGSLKVCSSIWPLWLFLRKQNTFLPEQGLEPSD